MLPREEVSATQLRDDLLSMLVAGHETTGSALTWTMYLLAQNPDKMAKVRSVPDSHPHTGLNQSMWEVAPPG